MKRRRPNIDIFANPEKYEIETVATPQFARNNSPHRSSNTFLAASGLAVLPIPPETPSKRKSYSSSINGKSTFAATPSPPKNVLAAPKSGVVRFIPGTVSPQKKAFDAEITLLHKPTSMIAQQLDIHNKGVSEDDDSEDGLVWRRSGSDYNDDSSSSDTINGRPKASPRSRKKRLENPHIPISLEGVDSYFHQNHKACQQTSTSTLANLPQLDHNSYFNSIHAHCHDHEKPRNSLFELHIEAFGQWKFELMEGFNILLFGYGSKRKLLQKFATYVYSSPGSVVVFNGYNLTASVKDLLTTVAASFLGLSHTVKLGATPNEQLDNILALLDDPLAPLRTYLIIHNIDGESLRTERSQSVISRLAAHPKISLVASVDHVRAPLLWDAARISQLNFLNHDCTTFEAYSAEISGDEILSLIDGTGRAGGTKGVKYVLASLPANAKKLFKVLISNQLQAMAEDVENGKSGGEEHGIEYRVLYQRALNDFICSNEVAFRTLLKEFQDHQMVVSKKDGHGTEIFWTPFRNEDLISILEDASA